MLDGIFTHHLHRRRGAGSLIVKWGTERADKMGLESFVDATNLGAELHKRHGFVATDVFDIDTKREGPGKEWKKLERDFPISYTFLWRPKGGIFDLRKTLIPWTGKTLEASLESQAQDSDRRVSIN